MQSLDGRELDAQLPNFTRLAVERRNAIFRATHKPTGEETSIPDPIFVTPEERTEFYDIENQTKAVISRRIENQLTQIQRREVRESLEEEWSTVRNQRKSELIIFVNRVDDELDGEFLQQVGDPEND